MIYLVIFVLLNIVFYFSTYHCCLCRWRMSLCLLLCAPFQVVSLGESLGMTKPSQWNYSLLNLNRALSPHSSAYWRGKIKNQASPCESCKLSAVRRVASPRDRAGDPVSCSACTSLPWEPDRKCGCLSRLAGSTKASLWAYMLGCQRTGSPRWSILTDHPILEDVGLLPAFLPPAQESEGAHPWPDGVNAYYTTSSFVT